VAEEVARVYPELVVRGTDGKVESVRYLDIPDINLKPAVEASIAFSWRRYLKKPLSKSGRKKAVAYGHLRSYCPVSLLAPAENRGMDLVSIGLVHESRVSITHLLTVAYAPVAR
jgi:hypothetical protein